ncbi:hypothetical protein E6C76_10965 [Pseudothauera nasutitermitis]|uniref:Uncharacterized protein n=1 Tax=Pseudothauera nasutitermitis TaxID=2565930 RepID=A0A4S4AWX9_9RHOO|nr:hypothetical protein [Pseudothauera nasutitermitis]THF64577.1 hypothetical protein E6C76_10965 [Pseudothauera nasutitermitis]
MNATKCLIPGFDGATLDYPRLAQRDPGFGADPHSMYSPEWTLGIGSDLFENGMELGYFQLGLGPFRRVYLWHDTQPGTTGLVFYTYEQVENPMGELLEEILRALAEGPGFWVLPGPGRIPVPRPIP